MDRRTVLAESWDYCTRENWSGWDPFDGLMLRAWPLTLLRSIRLGRLLLIQGMKRSPLNLRPFLGVPKLENPKALALGLLALARSSHSSNGVLPVSSAPSLAKRLLGTANSTAHGAGWGYPFDWQARRVYFPRGTPTVVCTGFVIRALDEALPMLGPEQTVQVREAMRRSAAFVVKDLNRVRDERGFCWSYSPLDRSAVVNATLLGAETVARVAARENEPRWLETVKQTVAWSLARQSPDGGWAYGEAGHHRWEDAFHTGFNIASLRAIREASEKLGENPENLVPQAALESAARHYASAFFDPDGRPWYYRHTPWPIDAHAAAVGISTLAQCHDLVENALAKATRTAEWTIANLWLADGHFSYQLRKQGRVTIPYLRWSQAWMVLALATLERFSTPRGGEPSSSPELSTL